MDNWIIWLAVGGAIGWMMHLIGEDSRRSPLLEVAVGIAGGGLGGWLLSPLMGGPGIQGGAAMLVAVMVALIGAETLLTVFKFARRRIEQDPRHLAASHH